MKLDAWNAWYRFTCPDEQADFVRKCGFFREEDVWLTKDVFAALRLQHYADRRTRHLLQYDVREAERNIANSFATTANGYRPPAPEGMEYLDYQRAGVAYLKEHGGGLLADDMGLGKTIQAIGFINELSPKSVLIVCPRSLKLNWKAELKKWLVVKLTYGIASPEYWPLSDIVIINYELLKKCHEALRRREWDIIIGDEIHYCKDRNTVRAREFYSIPCKAKLGITGTPLPNRVSEVYPVCHWLNPGHYPSYRAFKQRYEGGANREELHNRLRSELMVRRLKENVLPELPTKVRQIIEIPLGSNESVVFKELSAWNNKQKRIDELKLAVEGAKEAGDKQEYRELVGKLRDEIKVAFSEISILREKTARAKLPYAIEHLVDCIENEGKVVCFAYHKSVMDALEKHFGGRSVKIHGDTPEEQRHEAVNRFQTDPGCELFIGSFLAAGTGITLTAASHGVFIEQDWRPYVISQAEDRMHRIGQLSSVFIQHLVFEKSLGVKMTRKVVEKQKIIDGVLDNG